MDTISKEKRSVVMSAVRSKDTKPEMAIRRIVHSMGYRYRLHCSELPGKPDLVFRSRKKVIFIHGCFWHGHKKCRNVRWPKSNVAYWGPKIEGNKERDKKNRRKLKKNGWGVLVIWECEISELEKIKKKIKEFLG